eukprot:PhF_6_TR11554/c0_g1_i1/m.18570
MQPFSIQLLNGSQFTYSFHQNRDTQSLPLVVLAIDQDSDAGIRLASSDPESLDAFLLSGPPQSGTYLILGKTQSDVYGLQINLKARMSSLKFPETKKKSWWNRLAFAQPASITPLPDTVERVLQSWTSPRLTLSGYPRVDGANECFMQPYAQESDVLSPFVFQGCSNTPPPNYNASSVAGQYVLVNVTDGCTVSDAVAWAQNIAPLAKGVVVGGKAQPFPTMIGRNCTDVFYDNPFIPTHVSPEGFDNLASQARNTSVSVPLMFNFSCSPWGYGFVVNSDGVLYHLGWRKVNTLMFFAWEMRMHQSLGKIHQRSKAAQFRQSILRPQSVINPPAIVTIDFSTIVNTTTALAYEWEFEFTLTCPTPGDDATCGPWDRIISASVMCPSRSKNESATYNEVSRWITPFRRDRVGHWMTSADSLIATLLTNGTTCTVNVNVCCETWTATLDLIATPRSAHPRPPLLVVPLQYPNQDTTFDQSYDVNRTIIVATPKEATKVVLMAWISGHGSNPPPPVNVGCEYAPTSHAWNINNNGWTKYNTTTLAYTQYMLAGTPSGCQDKVVNGVIANQHGDYPDGRDGWCPGWKVDPIIVDVSSSWNFQDANVITYRALSYYVGSQPNWIPWNGTTSGCGGYI